VGVPRKVAAAVLACAVALAAAWALAGTRSARAQEPLVVHSALPPWSAPGTILRVGGRTAPETAVELWIGTRRRATAMSGPAGGFTFRVRVPWRQGRYPVAVVAGDTRAAPGALRVRPLTLAAVGDVTFGDGVGTAIARHGPRWPWRSVAPALRAPDLALANLEGAVSTRGTPAPGKLYTFRGPPAALRAAASFAGIDVVSLANNHSLDYGRAAFLDTIANARRFGLRTVGGGSGLTAARRPAIVKRGGLRVAFLGFSDVRPLGFDAGPGRPGTTPAFPEIVRADVRAARRRSDAVVAYFHWGIERATLPTWRQRDLAQTALDAGATVVLGAHPHVLQPVERRGRRLVAWSLGNFVFAAHSPSTRRTGILRVRLGARGVIAADLRRARIDWVRPRLVRH
jgi:poly-gamma-glutamate capsule biosynthesis protein CapA/YwtB (metallophosphatase superfamily)